MNNKSKFVSFVSPVLGNVLKVERNDKVIVNLSIAFCSSEIRIVRSEIWTNCAIPTADSWIAIEIPETNNPQIIASKDEAFDLKSFSLEFYPQRSGSLTYRVIVLDESTDEERQIWLGNLDDDVMIVLYEDCDSGTLSNEVECGWLSKVVGVESDLEELFRVVIDEQWPPDLNSGRKGRYRIGKFDLDSESDFNPVYSLSLRSLNRYISFERSKIWWIEPRTGSRRINKTEVDIQMFVWQQFSGDFCLLLAVPPVRLSYKNEYTLEIHCDKTLNGDNEPRHFYVATSSGTDVFQFVSVVFEEVRRYFGCAPLNNYVPTTEKSNSFIPSRIWDHLGWCTWNSYYKNVNESAIVSYIKNLQNLNIPFEFVLIDDGWQDYNDRLELKSFEMNTVKFPSNFKIISEIKRAGVKFVGVWHTLIGCWGGIDPSGQIALEYKLVEVTKRDGTKIHLVDSCDVDRFYEEFVTLLLNAAVDFVKVDHQAVFDEIVDADSERLWKSYQRALIQSTASKLPVIWSMSHSPKLLFNTFINSKTLESSEFQHALRTSDDFFPDVDDSHGWHVYANSISAMFSTLLINPRQHPSSPNFSTSLPHVVADWDMFQSKHKFAKFHAISRAISGAAVYLSDKPNEHDRILLTQMVVGSSINGGSRTPRCQQPAFPTNECAFFDFNKEVRLFKEQNRAMDNVIGVVGLFNCRRNGEEKFSGSVLDAVQASDVQGLKGEYKEFVAFFYELKEFRRVRRNERVLVFLNAGRCELVTFSPLIEVHDCPFKYAIFGLYDKINGAVVLIDSSVTLRGTDNLTITISLWAHGKFVLYVDKILATIKIAATVKHSIDSYSEPHVELVCDKNLVFIDLRDDSIEKVGLALVDVVVKW
ncbi:hypothetical protein HK098_005854 [Nowakowskiella sp. JEL0407]|nr:hypothetical protein HK098_005854 [Nowakowskiella sp. JEL0407]